METYGRYALRHLPEFLGLAIAVWIQFQLASWAAQTETGRRSHFLRRAAWGAAAVLAAACVFAVLAHFQVFAALIPHWPVLQWVRGAALAWALSSLVAFVLIAMWRRVRVFSPERRGFIRAAGSLAVAAPFGAVAYGTLVQRSRFTVREIDIHVANLPRDLNGIRITHISDIHLSPFLSEAELARAVSMANEGKSHLVAVTGDLITAEGDPLHACLRQLARLRSEAGTFGCLGNHEVYARCQNEAEAAGRRLGIDFLRYRNRVLRFGAARLNIGGVDWRRGPAFVPHGEKLIAPGAFNLLLCHNPNGFDSAAAQGWNLTLSGHTHGGQISVDIFDQSLNPARFFTRYVYGLYSKGPSSMYVTRGIGTVGIPARLGAPPEIAFIRLCAT